MPPTGLILPPLAGLLEQLRALDDPVVQLQLALRFDGATEVSPLRSAVAALPSVAQALDAQRADGSWGAAEEPRRRVLTTLWMTKTLAELGLDDADDGWHRAAGFLARNAHTGQDIMSLDGTDAGVLSCYIGLAGESYLLGGRPDLARPQIEWIVRFQDVRVGGQLRRRRDPDVWSADLRTRYGGCLADTTCLIGLIKTGRALAAWERIEPQPHTSELVAAIREVFLSRRLMYRSDGGIVPIGVYGRDPDKWLQPTFPLDWHTDLIEVLDFVASSGPPDPRMQPAIDRLASMRLPDGRWPLRRTFQPTELPAMERRSARSGSPMITLRVASALTACGARPS